MYKNILGTHIYYNCDCYGRMIRSEERKTFFSGSWKRARSSTQTKTKKLLSKQKHKECAWEENISLDKVKYVVCALLHYILTCYWHYCWLCLNIKCQYSILNPAAGFSKRKEKTWWDDGTKYLSTKTTTANYTEYQQ